jgi:tagatose-1,6-bisphosphate aldolase
MADMGWEEFMVVSEYDGQQHQTNRLQYVKDIRSLRTARGLGWIVDQVVKEDRPQDIVGRARSALVSRGWRP